MAIMERVDHDYSRGWRRYGFDNLPFITEAIHGSDQEISVYLAFNRGYKKAHISFATVWPTDIEAIGMHMHRDIPTGEDSEEWYIIIDGEAEMTFSNGDVTKCSAGDMIAIYPRTGHSFRAVNGPCRIISITPEMFHYMGEEVKTDDFPEEFSPVIEVTEVDPDNMCAMKAVCAVCGGEWQRPVDDPGAATLAVWARGHRHDDEAGR